jgi:tetratricopeptide (TPR) repeat protein
MYLGKVEVLSQGDYAQARRLLQESLDLCCELHDKVGIAAALHSQGELAFVEGNYRVAAARYTESLALECDMGNKELIAECLERLAEVWVTDGHPARAAQLLGAAETVRDTRQAMRVSMERAAYERTVAAIRRALGEAGFAVGWEEGRTMTLEQVMASAREMV